MVWGLRVCCAGLAFCCVVLVADLVNSVGRLAVFVLLCLFVLLFWVSGFVCCGFCGW